MFLLLAAAVLVGAGTYAALAATSPVPAQQSNPLLPAEPNGLMFGTALEQTTVSTTCGQSVMVGIAASRGTAVADCAGFVGWTVPPVIAAPVGETVYVQVNGYTELTAQDRSANVPADLRPQFSVSPTDAASIVGWTVTPRTAGKISVSVTGLDCIPSAGISPKTCTLMVIDAT